MKKTSYNKMYGFIENFARKRNLYNTLIALPLAVKYHEGQKRDDGEPYIMHPLRVCITLIMLRPEKFFRKTYPRKTEKWIWLQCDILFATALLHDSVEEAKLKRRGKELISIYHLHRKVRKNVIILSKLPKQKKHIWSRVYNEKKYYKKIRKSLIASLVKLSDRKDNCTTYGVFTSKRKVKYMKENEKYIYTLSEWLKEKYPEFKWVINTIVGIIKDKVRPYEYLLTGNLVEGVNGC